MAVAFVFRVYRHRGIAQHGFRPGSRDGQVALAAGQGVAEVPERPFFFFGNDFQVRDGGMEGRVPVDQAVAAVDQAFFVQFDKDLLHCGRQARVHGEALTRPVQGGAQAAQLPGDVAAGLLLPVPYFLVEFFATEFLAAAALCLQLPFHHHLGGDAGVVGAHLPEYLATLHAVVANQGVHD